MKLSECMELGKACGLTTIEECYNNIDLHSICIFKYEEIVNEILELQKDIFYHYPDEFCRIFNSNKEDFFEIAENNMQKSYDTHIQSLSNIIEDILEDVEIEELPATSELFSVSNERAVNGAAAVCIPEVMKTIADNIGVNQLIILPSSIHECLVGNIEIMPKEEAKAMVKEVNETQVNACDRLADNVYFFNTVTNEYSMY